MPSIDDKSWLSETEPIPYPSVEVCDDLSSIVDGFRATIRERNEILASFSWKATFPLRWIAAQLRLEKAATPHFHFGIVTPAFDAALPSLNLLWRDLQSQSHSDWTWMICSNGYSKEISNFVRRKNRLFNSSRQVVYNYIQPEPTNDPESLLANIGKRRDFCIDALDADYIFTIDADAKVLDRWMFSVIDSELSRTKKKICIYKILDDLSPSKVLPIFPITFARIDALNFCVDAKVARQVRYPIDVGPTLFGNEFRYLYRAYQACNRDYLFINRIFAEWNGNPSYDNLLRLRARQQTSSS
ncbi:MAG: hypothetical protein ACLP5V_07480 [Candidatus Bathyarchaeia archaeon]